jgi:ATP-dependent DNA helicase RecG
VSLLHTLRARGGDSVVVEAKRAGDGVPRLSETLCAFGNMPDGGTVLLGVDEQRGFAITGVADVAAMEAGVASKARHSVCPPVHVGFESVEVEGRTVLVVTVAGLPAADKPCRTHGRAYLRQSDGDYVMSEQEVAQLVAMQNRPRHDASPVPGASAVDLDEALAAGLAVEARRSSRRLKDEADTAIFRLKGVTNEGVLTVAGLYGLGSYPQQHMPSLSITAAALIPGSDRRLSDLAHLDGPIPDLLQAALEWVARNTRTGVVFDAAGNGRDEPELPALAVREFVANALVHRDLSPRTQSKQVEIRLLPDRLVITSPGGLWGVSRDQLGEPGGKSAVNEFLYEIGRLVRTADGSRVIEGEGGGIREAKAVLASAGLPEPVFVDTGVSFTVIVFRGNEHLSGGASVDAPMRLRSNPEAILAVLGRGTASVAGLAEATGLTKRQVKYALDKLISVGQVALEGGRGVRATSYRKL